MSTPKPNAATADYLKQFSPLTEAELTSEEKLLWLQTQKYYPGAVLVKRPDGRPGFYVTNEKGSVFSSVLD
jgi:hypothetical protein